MSGYGERMPGSRRFRRARYHRNPRTTQEKRKWDPVYGRKKRSPRRLPDNWDYDIPRSDYWHKTWKRYRKKQYRG